MLFQISYLKSFIISLLLLSVIYMTGILNVSSVLYILIIVLSYTVLLTIGFKYNKGYFIDDIFKLNINYLPVVIIAIIAFFLINISLSNIVYLIFNIEIEVKKSILSTIDIIVVLLIYPFFEELFHRKLILQGLYNRYGFKNALFVSSMIFAILHIFSENGIIIVFLGGVFLGYIYLKTKSFLISFIAHSLSNGLVLFISPIIVDEITLKRDNHMYLWIIIFIIGLITLVRVYYLSKLKNESKKRR